ncbi:MAG: hypothetical protein WC022_00450 [Parcubacteria group bacterium]
MDIRAIKNDRFYFWTNHAKYKLLQYGFSPTAIKNVIRRPERTEEGIAPETIAVMRRKDAKKTKREIWVMYQKVKKEKFPPKADQSMAEKDKSGGKIKIISAWIYPGVSPTDKEIFVPEDVWEALGECVSQ